jgi:hypothetical protein
VLTLGHGFLAAPLAAQEAASPARGQGTGVSAAQTWLARQLTPNRVVPEPDATRRGLVVSYALSPQKFPGGFHRSAIYDNAVAALVFLVTGDRDRAAFTLHALARLVRPDGSLWFAYNTANNWPTEDDHESALVRAGALSWVGYALSFYLAHVPVRSGNAVTIRERAFFREAAQRIATYLVSLQVKDSNDARDGLVRLGYGTLTLAYDPGAKTVVERYHDGPALGISTENNIAAWFFLRELAAVTGEARWREATEAIGHRLLESAWNDALGQFSEGFASDGARDDAKALDCAALGVLFLVARGQPERAGRALAALQRFYSSRSGTVRGYRPYADRPVYEDSAVGRFFFPSAPRREWGELPLVWSEGSLQVALAYLRAGQPVRARQVVQGLRPLQERQGGVRYASMEVPYEMTDAPSVAGSAWWVLVARALSGDSLAQQIWR